MRILIIDENDVVRSRLSELVESYTHLEIIQRAIPADGIELDADSTCPDVILLGLGAREADAPERIVSLRRARPNTRIIVLSDDPEAHLRTRCLEAGADVYLDKAMDCDRIVDVLCPTPSFCLCGKRSDPRAAR